MGREFKGSVAMAWLAEHGNKMCIIRFCNVELVSRTLKCRKHTDESQIEVIATEP